MAIDAATLRELKALDEASGGGLLDELVGLFSANTPERIARARNLLAAKDASGLADEAHALKGSAGALGASGLLKLAGTLESAARAADLSTAVEQLDAIEAEFQAALAELNLEKIRS